MMIMLNLSLVIDGGVGVAVPDNKYVPPTVKIPGTVEAEYFKQGNNNDIYQAHLECLIACVEALVCIHIVRVIALYMTSLT
jgi:hypothetical protein